MNSEIIKQAHFELEQEQFREAVEKYKQKLREKRTLWDKLFPWRVVFIRKGELNDRRESG